MPSITKEELLEKILVAETSKCLGEIMHMLPDCHGITVKDHVDVVNKIQEQNEFLKQKRAIVCLTPAERNRYINEYAFYTTYPDKEKLKKFAQSIQDYVLYEMIFEGFCGTVEELLPKSMQITEYLYQHHSDIDEKYAFQVALNEDIAKEIIKEVTAIVAVGNVEKIRRLLITLAQEISIVHSRYDHMCEHSHTLQQCYQIAIESYAMLSSNQTLREYVRSTSAPIGLPVHKTNYMLFS